MRIPEPAVIHARSTVKHSGPFSFRSIAALARSILAAIALLAFSVSCTHAQWQSFDRPGEDFRALTVRDSVVYALTSPYAIHTSGDRGVSWVAWECRVGATLEAFCLGVLDGKPVGGSNHGNRVIGAGRSVSVEHAVAGVGDDIQAVASTSRGGVSTWYLGGFGGGVRRSTDKGQSWTLCNGGLTNLNVTSLVTIPAPGDSGQILFAGTYGGGVFRSTDDGSLWTTSGAGLADLHVYAVTAQGDTLYAAHSGGHVSRSSDAGATWAPLGTGLPYTDVISLAQIASGNERYVFAGTIDGGVWRYSPASTAWEPMNTGLKSMRINAIVAMNDVLILGTDRGLYRSTDAGLTWQSADSGAVPPVNAVYAIPAAPGAHASRIFTVSDPHYSCIEAYHGATPYTSKVYWTDDLGSTWTTVPFYPNYVSIRYHFTSFASLHKDCMLLFSAGSDEADLLRCVLSTDRGTTWSSERAVLYMLYCKLSGLAIRDIPAEQRFEIYITTAGGPWPGMASSLDSGKTWSPKGLPNDGHIRAPLISEGSLIYAASDSSALRTSDGCLTWDRITYNGVYGYFTPSSRTAVPMMGLVYANSTRLFANVKPAIIPGEGGGLYASTDRGDSWTFAGFPGQVVTRIVEADSILFALQGGHIFASRTDTLRWKEVGGDLSADTVAVISASPEHLVALTEASDRIWYRPMAEIKAALTSSDPTSTPGTSTELPATVTLLQNYPNPFNPTTTIGYELPASTHVKLAIFDLLGREVAVLVDESKEAGRHAVTFDATGLASGVYFYRLHITPSAWPLRTSSSGVPGEAAQTKVLILLR